MEKDFYLGNIEEMRGMNSLSLFIKTISPFTNHVSFEEVFEQLGPMASEPSITCLRIDLAYKRKSHIIERV